jgi:hypothetical protein
MVPLSELKLPSFHSYRQAGLYANRASASLWTSLRLEPPGGFRNHLLLFGVLETCLLCRVVAIIPTMHKSPLTFYDPTGTGGTHSSIRRIDLCSQLLLEEEGCALAMMVACAGISKNARVENMALRL